jgi:hypothetical protein
MTVLARSVEGAGGGQRVVPERGTHVRVRFSRGRLPLRTGAVLDIRPFDGRSHGSLVVVRWDDDRSISCLVPGTDIDVTGDDGP